MPFAFLRRAMPILVLSLSMGLIQALDVRLSLENTDCPPYALRDQKGLCFIMLSQLEAKVPGVKFSFSYLPWERCLSEMQKGDQDGALPASFKEKRLEMGAYPMKDGKPDEGRRMYTASFSLLGAPERAAKVSVDGFKLGGVDAKADAIGANQGYSIADDLRKAGFIIEENKSTEANLRKLIAGRLAFVAAQTTEAQALILRDEFKGKVVEIQPPVVAKPYYLMLSKQFVAAHPAEAEAIWNGIGVIRESPAFREAEAAYLAGK